MNHPLFQSFLVKYEVLRKEYISGTKRKTAQYCMMYVILIELQHKLHYSINVNNYDLRLSCWNEIVHDTEHFIVNKWIIFLIPTQLLLKSFVNLV